MSARLQQLRERSGLSVRALAELIDRPLSSYSSYERSTYKKRYLPMDLVLQVADVLTGRGQPPILKSEVLELGGVTGIRSSQPDAPSEQQSRTISIPEYDVRPQAGGGAEMPELDGNGEHPVVATWSIPAAYLRSHVTEPSAIRIIQVAGDSMEPDYPAGERVAVDTSHRVPSPPGVYVLWDGFGLVLKRVEIIPGPGPRRVRLMSINPAYPAYEVPLDEVQINGRLIGKWMWR